MPAAQILIAPGASPHCGIKIFSDLSDLINSVVSTSSVKSKYPMPSLADTLAIFLFTAKGPADITASAPLRKSLT